MEFEYYATEDTDHGGRAEISQQRRHLDQLVDLSSNDDYSSGHNKYSHGYHSLEGHLQGLGLTSGQHSSTDYSSTGEYLLAALNIEVLVLSPWS